MASKSHSTYEEPVHHAAESAQFAAYSVIPDDILAPAPAPATTNVSAPLRSPIDVDLEESEYKSKKFI